MSGAGGSTLPPPSDNITRVLSSSGPGPGPGQVQSWVGMTQVGSEEVRTSRWMPRQRSSGTTGGTSGSTSMSLKLSDSFMKS